MHFAQRQVLAAVLIVLAMGLLVGSTLAFSYIRARFKSRIGIEARGASTDAPAAIPGKRPTRKQTLAFDPKDLRTIDSADTLPK
jgi:hypothetical protein